MFLGFDLSFRGFKLLFSTPFLKQVLLAIFGDCFLSQEDSDFALYSEI